MPAGHPVEREHGPAGRKAARRDLHVDGVQHLDLLARGGECVLGRVSPRVAQARPCAAGGFRAALGGIQEDFRLAAPRAGLAAGTVLPRLALGGLLCAARRLVPRLFRMGQVLCRDRTRGLPLLPERAVIAPVSCCTEGGEFDDGVHLLQKLAIVARNDRAAGPSAQEVEDRATARPVEIVRRFIHEQEIGFREDQRREGRPAALTTRESGKPGPRIDRQVAAGKCRLDPGGQGPVRLGQLLGHGPAALRPVHEVEGLPRAKKIGHGLVRVRQRLLAHHGHRAGHIDPPGGRKRVARDHAQKRALSRAVAADKPGALGAECQIEIGEKRCAVRCGPRQAGQGNGCRHGTGLLATKPNG